MAALKISLLLSVALGFHIIMTPPNPPPLKTEQLPPTGLEHLAPKWLPRILKAGFWAVFLAEIAVIGARRVSLPSAAATAILGTLDRTGGSARLKITPIFLLGWALNLLGSSLRMYCYRRLRTLFTFELSIRQNHHLITKGVYSIVRHPSYTGFFVAGVGTTLCQLAPGSWVVECSGLVTPGEPWAYKIIPIGVAGLSAAWIGLTTRMRKEDGMLREKFGTEWEAWAANVRYKIFPGVF
ncbi:hypothetical protein DFH09DRAFT_918322 [Mycena vulgaris]|nr:hypothetical protein DFH09DRAFT_918322 [Mycena vulgaris]